MKYKISNFLNLNYSKLTNFLERNEKLNKEELLERCTGNINLELFQSIKYLEFNYIEKKSNGDLFIS